MQRKLNSVINKLILVAEGKMSGCYKSSYKICALSCLWEYGCLFFQGLLPMRCLSRWLNDVIRNCSFALGMNGASSLEVFRVFLMKAATAGSDVTRTAWAAATERRVKRMEELLASSHKLYEDTTISNWKAAACYHLAWSREAVGNSYLSLLFLFLLPLQKVKGVFNGLSNGGHAFKLKLFNSS